MKRYNPAEIEPKWQQTWEKDGIYHATEDPSKPKRYVLEYFPYPSGAAMHVGHVRNYTIGDAMARHYRMRGYNVMHPMGWDAFGLPAENYAIKNNISPKQAIAENTAKFKQQLIQMGFSYDWSREINSSDPSYYKWTQWFFKLLFERGLAYQKDSLQWWCPHDKTVLANEQVEAGRCWRCGHVVVKKPLKQWFFKITDYADRLSDDLDKLDWSEAIKSMQRNWIGRSEGAAVKFSLSGLGSENEHLEVFTTAHDTIYGATFMVVAPEHPIVQEYAQYAENWVDIQRYVDKAAHKSELDREIEKQKTGVEIKGLYAINPINGQKIPVWIADYVLISYGTGAIMAVPGEDERDYKFAQKYNLPITYTTEQQEFIDYQSELKTNRKKYKLANSGEFDGLDFETGREKILEKIQQSGAGEKVVQYKIRDWLISRQRYWGAPIPIIHCPEHGAVPVPDDQLPVELPEVKSYLPTGEGTSVLASVPEWVNTACPTCGKPAKRETDTMDGFACSSWYFLRFADPHNDEKPFDADKVKFWLPVDDYIGGAEHAVMHLLYARMWTKVMFDAGMIEFDEPFTSLRNHGMILAPDGRKMSKSWGNVIAPDDIIAQGYGADAIRIMELFIGPWNQEAAWSVEGMGGCYRFLQRVWNLVQEYTESATEGEAPLPIVHKTIKKVSDDIERMSFNTAIAAQMELVNELHKAKADGMKGESWQFTLVSLIQIIAPFAPHITEELWQQLGQKGSVHISNWPKWDDALLIEDTMKIVLQVNGKVRAEISVANDASKEDVESQALDNERVQEFMGGKQPKRVIYVPGRLVNIVV
jgi:leucyl-tRNA synthetase